MIPDEFDDGLQSVLTIAAGLVAKRVSVQAFLDWSRSAIPLFMPALLESVDPEDRERMAFWLGVSLWNAAPLPGNRFRPAPLPKPERNAPCPCGSTRKYKQCCARLPPVPTLPGDIYWHYLPEVCSKRQVNEWLESGHLPVEGVIILVHHYADDGDDAQVIRMLDPLFAGEAKHLSRQHEGLLDLLCDAYNHHYSTDRKKRDLLQRMCRHPDRVIRSEAWQRMATWQQDQGNFTAAHEALGEAMKADPDNPSHALLELVLLVSQGQLDRARQRATFWYARLQRFDFEFPELVETIGRARQDPVGALEQQVLLAGEEEDDRLGRLLAWLNTDRPLPTYRVKLIGTDEGAPAGRQLETIDMFCGFEEDGSAGTAEDTLPDIEDPMKHAASLLPPPDIAELETSWRQIAPLDKPFSIDLESPGAEILWDDVGDDEWLGFLEEHPELVDSLDVLDDVFTLLSSHPLNESLFFPISEGALALQRACNILRQAPLPPGRTLPWICLENRPALRLLVRHIMAREELGAEEAELEELMAYYLRLNPPDNHGYRCQLVNAYLRQGRYGEAAAICVQYPHDMMPETRYGHVLALYRLGDLEAAARQLEHARRDLPEVVGYLTRSRPAKPKLHAEGVRIGGRDQAWIYREEMRDCWAEADGCLQWLKAQA